MAGEYANPITIEEAILHIVKRGYLLPAIQRKFTWSSSQICVLFDSIMRGYPINTFMFWKVSSKSDLNVTKSFRFYHFLEHYCERFGENNLDFNTKGHGDFHAVIDGQQRLTSLYIGLKGTYAYKLPRKWWPSTKDDSILPPRKLYLNLFAPLDEETNEGMMHHELKFLTDAQFKEDQGKPDKIWFQVGDIFDFDKAETCDNASYIVKDFLQKQGHGANSYALEALTRLYSAIRLKNTIYFYEEESQSIDEVLRIFIRANNGGTPLAFSDLLMSIAVANWKKDARQQIDDLVDVVRVGSEGFSINRDFILKTALMISNHDVRFKVENFTEDHIAQIEQEWDDIKACIVEVFRLIRSFGLKDVSLRAKNAAIPIAYYLFHKGRDKVNGKHGLYVEINNQARHAEDRKQIRQWLHMSLLRGVFGGQGDSLLTKLRKIIRTDLSSQTAFPLNKIVAEFRGTGKDLVFDDDFIDRLLKTQKDDSSCFSILALLFPDLDYTRTIDKDHLHPAVAFNKKNLDATTFLVKPERRAVFENPENWNSIANLHLLDASRNRSKQDEPLEKWFNNQNGMKAEDLLIPSGTDMAFESFDTFIVARFGLLKKKLLLLVQ